MQHLLTIPYTKTHKFKSKINDIEYELFVVLPQEYKNNKDCYPVIFTTDPSFILLMLYGITNSLYPLISKTIIVGIGHADLDFKELTYEEHDARIQINRARDLLPWKFDKSIRHFSHNDLELEAKIIESSGLAAEFKNFITEEVLSFIDKTYRTTKERTLVGHSFGGIFASFIMLNNSSFFSNYLIISPILNFEDGLIFNEINNLSKTASIKAYFCAGSLESGYSTNENFLADLKRFHDQINLLPNIITKVEIFADEYHASVVPLAISKGLRFLLSK